jgi:hypothetical protein
MMEYQYEYDLKTPQEVMEKYFTNGERQ